MFRLRLVSFTRLSFKPRVLFSQNPESQNNSNPTESTTSERSKFEEFTDSFFEVLKQSKKTEPYKNEVNYTYNSRTIYHNKIDPKIFNSNNRTRFVVGSLWMVIGYASFAYIHPFITIIPAWFASGSFLGYFMGRNYAQKLVSELILNEDQKNITIKVVKGGKEIKAKLENMDLFDIVELKERNPKKTEQKPEKVSDNFVCVFDLKDENGKEMQGMRMFIDKNNTKFENIDLFKYVLLGNQEEVDKFKFVEEKEKVKEQEKEAQDIDKKIEEEFERIKKETEEKK